MTLQALRNRIGDDASGPAAHLGRRPRYGNATTDDFTALAEGAAGRTSAGFFKVWLYAGAQADRTTANGL